MNRVILASVKKAIASAVPVGFVGGVDGALLRKESGPKVSKAG